MRRFVSVWLPHLAIERQAGLKPGQVPVEHAFGLVETGARGLVITAVNQVARQHGIVPGLPLADARAALPALLTGAADRDGDAAYLRDLALWCGRYGPDRNTDGCDELWIDTTGVAHLFARPGASSASPRHPAEAALSHDLITRLAAAGLTARAAIAGTREAAHALARYATSDATPALHIADDVLRDALAPLPVRALCLAEDTITLLRRLGLGRIGQLYDLPRAALARRFQSRLGGSRSAVRRSEAEAGAVLARLDAALGHAPTPRAPLVEPPVHAVRLPFVEPLICANGVAAAVADLAGLLCARLTDSAEGARALRLLFYRSDGSAARADLALSAACRDPGHISDLFAGRLEGLDLGLGIDMATLEAVRVEPITATQTEIRTRHGDASPERLAPLIDRLVTKLGADSVYRLEQVASHLPERAQRRRSALATPLPPSASRPLTRGPPRPPFLLPRPEPIAVVAEVPDGPPARFTWRRVARIVARAEGPERIAPEWWRAIGSATVARTDTGDADGEDDARGDEAAAPPPRPLTRTRDYYSIEDTAGARYWVFCDGLYGREDGRAPPAWYMHGVFG